MLPNLFHFATSELTQDAVICWLLSWAEENKNTIGKDLHEVGKAFLINLYQKSHIDPPATFFSIKIEKQVGGIDILCVVNKEWAILIEDKVGTQQHSDQLSRYKNDLSKRFQPAKTLLIYLQTGDQSNYSEVQKNGYQIIRREDLLKIFESEVAQSAKSSSDIFHDFSDHLRQIENKVQSYLSTSLSQWSWNAWVGFYTAIQPQLPNAGWGYVPNPAGGFLGFWWWDKLQSNECDVKCQLEQEKFCFKITVPQEDQRQRLRQLWSEKIISASPRFGLTAQRPARFGTGEFMTVANLTEYRVANSDGIINMEATLKLLKSAQSVVDSLILAGN